MKRVILTFAAAVSAVLLCASCTININAVITTPESAATAAPAEETVLVPTQQAEQATEVPAASAALTDTMAPTAAPTVSGVQGTISTQSPADSAAAGMGAAAYADPQAENTAATPASQPTESPDPGLFTVNIGTTEVQEQGGNNSSAVINDYSVTICSASVINDYNGSPALAVTYEFTNNSEHNVSFASAMGVDVFQEGVECKAAVIADASYNSMGILTQVPPGATNTFQVAYSLRNTVSPVTVYVTDILGSSGISVQKVFNFKAV